MKHVINDSTIAKINQQSAKAVYYHVQRTGLSTAVILATGKVRDMLLIYQEKNVLVDFSRKSLFLVDMP